MKRVLITGANSYVGTNIERFLSKEPNKYYVETLDMKDANWINFDFSSFDVVFHVAGIAHVSTKKNMKDLYFKINRDLTIETARKAKTSGVKQFIFMSSMIVYNTKEKKITLDTKPNPDNFYGLSKLQAEEGILKLQSQNFSICILRPPMIYDAIAKNNLKKIVELVKKSRILPNYLNTKSVVSIQNLSQNILDYIDFEKEGVFFPKDEFTTSTTSLVELYLTKEDKIYKTKILNPLIRLLVKSNKTFKKIFGDFYYDM